MTNAPLLCLPGFMGNGADFAALRSHLALPEALPNWQWPDPDSASAIAVYAQQCWQQIAAELPPQFTLYAYSMGGRIALHWLAYADFQQRCQATFIASAHTGLREDAAKQTRLASDLHWAERFANQPLHTTLNEWYQQPVFASLSAQQKQSQIQAKLNNDPQQLSRLLRATSLANQQDLTEALGKVRPFTYFVGELDPKFMTLSHRFSHTVSRVVVPKAGHIVHAEQPKFVAQQLAKTLLTGDTPR